MKKLIAVFAVLLFVAPAFAADWSFYGSQRVASWYTSKDYGDAFAYPGEDTDAATQFYFQDNSRLGAKVKADKVTGQVELALNAGSTNGGDVVRGSNGGDGSVTARRAYGTWKFADNASLKVGKDYSPVTDFISNSYFNADGDLLGVGNFYGRRPSGLTLILGNFELAALTPNWGSDVGTTATGIYVPNAAGTAVAAVVAGDPDSYIPRFEASYNLMLGAGYIKPFGGVQYYTIQETNGVTITDDIDVLSWMLGVSTSWNIGAFSIGGQVSYGSNQGAVQGWQVGTDRFASSPVLKTDGSDIDESYTLQAMIVPALKFTDTLRFEAGFGYRMDDPQYNNAKKDEQWQAYVQLTATLAPGVFLCPEVGYIDNMEDVFGNDQGSQWYAGAKWQIDF